MVYASGGWLDLDQYASTSEALRQALGLGYPIRVSTLIDQLAEELGLDTRRNLPEALVRAIYAMIEPLDGLAGEGYSVLDERPRAVAVTAVADLDLTDLHTVCVHLDLKMRLGAETQLQDLPDVVRSRAAAFLVPRVQRMVLRWEKAGFVGRYKRAV